MPHPTARNGYDHTVTEVLRSLARARELAHIPRNMLKAWADAYLGSQNRNDEWTFDASHWPAYRGVLIKKMPPGKGEGIASMIDRDVKKWRGTQQLSNTVVCVVLRPFYSTEICLEDWGQWKATSFVTAPQFSCVVCRELHDGMPARTHCPLAIGVDRSISYALATLRRQPYAWAENQDGRPFSVFSDRRKGYLMPLCRKCRLNCIDFMNNKSRGVDNGDVEHFATLWLTKMVGKQIKSMARKAS